MIWVNATDCESDVKGKTWREKNSEISHKIKIGTLVEIESGVRLFVVNHIRDCDQTPLYVLAPYMHAVEENENNPYINHMLRGYSEDSIKIVK